MLKNPRKRVLLEHDESTITTARDLSIAETSSATLIKRHRAAYDGFELPLPIQGECARLVTNDPVHGKRGKFLFFNRSLSSLSHRTDPAPLVSPRDSSRHPARADFQSRSFPKERLPDSRSFRFKLSLPSLLSRRFSFCHVSLAAPCETNLHLVDALRSSSLIRARS